MRYPEDLSTFTQAKSLNLRPDKLSPSVQSVKGTDDAAELKLEILKHRLVDFSLRNWVTIYLILHEHLLVSS
jgi:hypothetical protein